MKTHQPVLDWIEEQLASGSLAVGDRLPGERALAERFQLSRASVREAMRVLEALGVIRSAVGSGPDAGTKIMGDPSPALGTTLRFHVASSSLPVADVVEARVMLESWACQHTDRESPAVQEARLLLDEMQEVPSGDLGASLALDVLFHYQLALASGNAVISAMMLSLREAISSYLSAQAGRLEDWPAVRAQLQAEHADILSQISEGAGRAAAESVTSHIRGFYDLVCSGAAGSGHSRGAGSAKELRVV